MYSIGKIGVCGHEDLFFRLHQFLVEKIGVCVHEDFFLLNRPQISKNGQLRKIVSPNAQQRFAPLYTGSNLLCSQWIENRSFCRTIS